MPVQSTRTLTQRRTTASSPSVASSINTPPPMAPTNLTNTQSTKSSEGSSPFMKVAIWGVVVLLIAGAVYLLINNVMTNKNNGSVTPTPTVTPTEEAEEPETITASKLDSSLAESAPKDSDFKKADQTLGEASEDQFTIQSFKTESYDKFFRLVYEVSSSGDTAFPLVSATYNTGSNSIDLAFKGVINDNSGLEFEVPQKVEGSIVTSITRRATSEENVAKYTIGISEEAGFFLHSLTDPNRVVVDIQEPAVTPTPSVTTTVTPTPSTSGEKPAAPHLTNEFSKDKQYIVTTLTTNTVSTPKYAFRDFGTYLKITYDLSGGIPNVVGEINGNDLIITMSNRITNNKTSTVEINNGNVTTMDVVSSGNTTTYTIHLVKASDYRIYATESPAQFMIEIKD